MTTPIHTDPTTGIEYAWDGTQWQPLPTQPPKGRKHTGRNWAIGIAAALVLASTGIAVAVAGSGGSKHAANPIATSSPASAATSTAPAGTDPAVYSAKLSELSTALGDVSTNANAGDETAAEAACASGAAVVHEMQAMTWPTGPTGAGADSMQSALSILDEGFNACTLGDWDTTSADISSATAYLTAATNALGS